MKQDASTQPQPGPAALPDESAKAKPRLEAAKSRVANFLTAFTPKKRTSSEKPSATEDGPVRPVIGSDRAALFLDSKGRIVAAQPRCAGFFGRQPEELIGLNVKELLKPGFDQEITNILEKGKEASEQSFHVLALRKDGLEFATQFSFKYLQDVGFRWALFVQAPPGSSSGEAQTIVPTTETATTETPKPASDEKPPAPPVVRSRPRNPEQLAAQLEASQNERKRLERLKFEAEKHLRQAQTDYGNRLIQLEQDLSDEREINERLSKRLEAQEQSVSAQMKGMRKLKEQQSHSEAAPEKTPADLEDLKQRNQELNAELQKLQSAGEQAEARLRESTARCSDWEKKVADLTKTAADLAKNGPAGQTVDAQSAQRVKELEQQSAVWEKRAADLKKSLEEFAHKHAAEQNAAVKAAQRVQELEEQLKRAGDNQAAGKKDVENQGIARQKLEAENRSLTEANAKAKAELDKEREAIKVSQKKEEELQAQIQKLQKDFEQAEARARESAAQSKDSEYKVVEIKKTVDELIRNQAAEQNVGVKAAQRVKELEQQLKRAGDDLAASKTEIEKQNSARQKLEAEYRNLTEASAGTKAEVEKEREANKLSRKRTEELNTLLQKVQQTAEQTEKRAHESAAQAKDWEKQALDHFKSVDELTKSHAAEQSAATKRVKELEQQLKRAVDDLAAGKTDVQKAEARASESATQSKDWEKKATDLKKSVDELTKGRAADQSAAAKRVKELEQQLKRAGDDLAAGKTEAQKAEARAGESAAQAKDWEKKAADFKKSADELTKSHAVEKNAAAKATERAIELEQQLNRAADDLAANKEENRKLIEAAAKRAAQEKKASELEQRARARVFSLAKVNAELQKERVDRERAEKNAASAIAQTEKLREKLKQQGDLDRAAQSKIEELEKTIHDRGDALARASAALRKEAKEREVAQKQSRLVSDIGTKLESNLASLDDAKKVFEASSQEKDEQLKSAERSLADAHSSMEKELAERHRLERLLADAKKELEKVSAESKVEISRLQAAVDLGELERKKLEGDLLRAREEEPGEKADSRKK